ncbi:MAG TPA: hypothetical protein VK644_05260, partial [Chitinophagaceae bacterium]|nr:hypothetical protein [Chitinophagaceae bacterium]
MAFIGGGILVLLVAFHFWFVNHAEELIENMVSSTSKGKLMLKVKKFKFNWFSHKMELQNAVFYSTDTVSTPNAYRFKVDRIKIQVNALLPIIFEKRIYIDSIRLINPDISVTRLRPADDTLNKNDTNLSIPQEMGRIYNSIQDALKVLKVDRFRVENGTFSMINKSAPEEKPVTITRLAFQLDNLRVDSNKTDAQQRILFSDNVFLQTTHQDILFPDGRHRLSFSNFHINILKRLVEFDSCTIVANKGDSSHSSFRIFFDKLLMTNIDFDTLYHNEVIKADSVYCINPKFQLDVSLGKRTGLAKPPPLNDLIQQLTGDMELAFVVVENGSFDINTLREGRPSSFRSDHNNFELQGLRIQKNAPKPLVVERFAMAIRNYENFLRDSAYAIQFDSILINNKRISLSNFSYKELKNDKVVNQFIMPQFELYGLSWDNLIFDQQLAAERVTLYKPLINYNLSQAKTHESQDIFGTLSDLSNFMQLNNLNIVDGKINLYFRNKGQLQLENATIFVKGQQLVASRKLARLRQSFDLLNFKKGFFKMNDVEVGMDDVQFNGTTNQLKAGSLHIKDKQDMSIEASHVAINAMIVDEKLQNLSINGIHWEKANVNISSLGGQPNPSKRHLILNDISGKDTKITVAHGTRLATLHLATVAADEFSAGGSKSIVIKGFSADGNDLEVTDSHLKASIKTFTLADHRVSQLKGIVYTNYKGSDSVDLEIPSVTLVPDMNAIINGDIIADEVRIVNPVVRLRLVKKEDLEGTSEKAFPDLALNRVVIIQPRLDYVHTGDKGLARIEWSGKEDSIRFELNNIKMKKDPSGSLSVGSLLFRLSQFKYQSPRGRIFDAGKGTVSAQLEDLALQKDDAGDWEWRGNIKELTAKDFVIDSLGHKAGRMTLHSAKLNDLTISSSNLLSLRQLMADNRQFRLREISGNYHNEKDIFNWRNMAYDKSSRRFTMDSFSYHPTPDRDAFIKSQPYQSDYLAATTGKVIIGPFDIERYIRDSVLDLGSVSIDNGYMTDFRDKRIPREPGLVTLLPVNMLKQIPVRLFVDSVKISGANVVYEETNEKSGKAGRVTIDRMNGRILRLRNFNFSSSDSLEISAAGI